MWDNDLVELTIEPGSLGDSLVYEDLYGEAEEFPHVYEPIPTVAVLATRPFLTHLEEGMWLPGFRFDRDWMDKMLHPDFVEVGMSGRTHTRKETVRSPAAQIDVQLPHEDYRMVQIDENVAMSRYVSNDVYEGVARRAHRTSIWLNTKEGWRMRFHQGTPIPIS